MWAEDQWLIKKKYSNLTPWPTSQRSISSQRRTILKKSLNQSWPKSKQEKIKHFALKNLMNRLGFHFSKISDVSNSSEPTKMVKCWRISNPKKSSSKEATRNNYKLHKTNSAYRLQTSSAWLKSPSPSWICAGALKDFMIQTSPCTFLQACHPTKTSSRRNWWSFFIARVRERTRFRLLKRLRKVSTLMTVFSWKICSSGCLKIKTDQFLYLFCFLFKFFFFCIVKLIQISF